ncbi:hypothetical protein PYCCODRAFT_148891 [Trametes coccinea BRFM310]|uniref:RlpA-like protein double-psi beta-barrel domain-containing protein n=1 Tax=Trametes coccinea (strain BRFM310) TaxID=1353009 RepID=A0A1Y2IWM3_TRAC3|nr:hypothetical protein PYCCODRAFT_148891 [Trametes coccinea BRFM310]
MALERKYTTPHSLGEGYVFSARDGWETVNMTDLVYKYSRANLDSDLDDDGDGDDDYSGGFGLSTLEPRAKKAKKSQSKASKKTTKKAVKNASAKVTSKAAKATTRKLTSSAGGVLSGGLSKVVNSIKGIGKPEPVTITWYTGHDLLNPSCWDNTDWHPTDASFAAALTMEGWTTKPKCFKFLELCHSAQKCAFVRVVDSCAGCAKGSKHVDLTKAAFMSLADLNQGMLTVQMRPATDPEDGWLENLWGPKV